MIDIPQNILIKEDAAGKKKFDFFIKLILCGQLFFTEQ